MHHVLARQLQKLGLSVDQPPDSQAWRQLLEHISQTYDDYDRGRSTIEVSSQPSADEMLGLYEQLKHSTQARIAAIARALPDQLLLVSHDGRVLETLSTHNTSGASEAMDEEAPVGQELSDIMPPIVTERLRFAIDKALSESTIQSVEYEMTTCDGDREFEARVVPANLDDEDASIVLLARDVTERNHVERRSRLVGKVVEAAAEGVVILDSLGRVLSVNPAFERIFGYSETEVIGRQAAFLQDRTDRCFLSTLWRELNTRGGWRGEITALRYDGNAFPLWLTMDSVNDERGSVTHYVALLNDVSELKRSREELEHVATHDNLTGLPNRLLFHDRLEHALARSVRAGVAGAILFLDLDRFKTVNDNLGHHIGDRLLQQVAARLGRVARAQDTLARLGGDEFTLILEDLEEEELAARVAEKIIAELNAPFDLGDVQLDITTSIGISVFPRDGHAPGELLKHADTAMYSAKEAGRNRYRFFTQELTINAFEHFSLEQSLRRAIAAEEFFLQYQPQFDVAKGGLAGIEALIRWRTQDGNLVPPGQFIHVAEISGIIETIGIWVVETVCEQIKQWDAARIPVVPVAINLSARQLANPELANDIKSVLRKHQIDGARLEFEITESAIITHADIAFENLTELHQTGARLAIDDFGTGHSSLVNLKRFPLSRLKIDRTFVRDVAQDPNDEAIIRATIALARSLGLEVIAEGVENSMQLQFLREAGCELVQGYLLGAPMSVDLISDLLCRSDQLPTAHDGT